MVFYLSAFDSWASKLRQRAYNLAVKYVNRRVEEGSNVKDLFYHLVSEIVIVSFFHVNEND
jgi:hypothetical protein